MRMGVRAQRRTAAAICADDEKVKVSTNYGYMFLVDLVPAKANAAPKAKR